jgi:tape measure domain-containing protein
MAAFGTQSAKGTRVAQDAMDRYVNAQVAATQRLAKEEAKALNDRARFGAAAMKQRQAASLAEIKSENARVTAGIAAMKQRQAVDVAATAAEIRNQNARVAAGISAMRAREAADIKAYTNMNRLHARALVENKKFDEQVRLNTQSLGGWTTSLGRVAAVAGTVITAISALSYAAYRLIKPFVDAEVAMTQIMLRLQVASGGDMQRAGEMFEFISSQAKRVGISLEDAALSFSRFQANVRGTSMEGKVAEDVFIGVSEAAAAMGLSSHQVGRAFLALEQMVSKGTVQMEELRGQLSEQIPGAFQTAAKAMGITTKALAKLMKTGDVDSIELVKKLAAEWHKMFGPTAAQNAERLTGTIAGLQSAWFRFKTELEVSGALKTSLQQLASIFDGIADSIKRTREELSAFATERLQKMKLGNLDIGDFTADEVVELGKAFKGLDAGLVDAQRRINQLFDAALLRKNTVAANEWIDSQKVVITSTGDMVKQLGEWSSETDEVAVAQTALTKKLAAIAHMEEQGIGTTEEYAAARRNAYKDFNEVLDKVAKSPAQQALENLRKSIQGFTQDIADSLAVDAEFSRILVETGGDYAAAEMGAAAYSEVLKAATGASDEQIASLTAQALAAKKVEKATDDTRKAVELFIEVANQDAEAIEGWAKEQQELIESSIDAQFEWKHEISVAKDYLKAIQNGVAGLREFDETQQRIVAKLKTFEHLKEVFDAISSSPFFVGDLWGQFVKGVEAGEREMDRLAAATEIAAEKMQILADLVNGMFTGVVDVWVDALADFVKTGEFSFKELAKSLLGTFIDVFAQMFKAWLLLQAQMAATDYAAKGGGGGTGSWMNTALKLFGQGKSGSSLFGGGAGGVTVSGAGSGLAGPAGAGTISGSVSGGVGAGGAVGGAAFGGILAAAVLVFMHLNKIAKERMTFGTTAGASVGQGGGLNVGWSGKLDQTGPLVAQKLGDLLHAFENGTGTFITGMADIAIKIRNDKSVFTAVVDGVEASFDNMNEAIIFAAKKAFSHATFAAAVDPIFQSMIKTFEGLDPDKFTEAANLAKTILDAASGLSELGNQIRGVIPSIHGMMEQLLGLGVAFDSAVMLTAKFAASTFTALYRQITGIQETPKEELARRKIEAELFNAQLALYRLEIQARAAKLRSDIGAAKAQFEIWKTENKGRVANLVFQTRIIKAEGTLIRQEAVLAQQQIRIDAAKLKAEIELWEAELKVLDEVLGILAKLNIDIGKIRLSGTGKPPTAGIDDPRILRGGGTGKMAALIDRWKEAMESLIKTVRDLKFNSSTTALTMREQLVTAMADFRANLGLAQGGNVTAAESLPETLQRVLELAKTFSGGGTGLGFLGGPENFRDFFNLLLGQSEGLATGPRPRHLREGSEVFNERFLRTAERSLLQATKLTVSNIDQNESIIRTGRQSVTVESAILKELKTLNATNTQLRKAS